MRREFALLPLPARISAFMAPSKPASGTASALAASPARAIQNGGSIKNATVFGLRGIIRYQVPMTASAPVRSLASVSSQPKPPRLVVAEPGLVAADVYANGKRLTDIIVDEVGEWSRRPNHVVWLDLHEPSEDLLRRVQRQLGLHELAIDDALQAHQQPKLEQYGEATFIVTRTAQMVDGQLALGDTHIFVGPGYVVTVRHGASTPFSALRQRCETCPTSLAHSEGFILSTVLGFSVDNYGPVLDGLRAEVEAIEDQILTKTFTQGHSERLYLLRRNLL